MEIELNLVPEEKRKAPDFENTKLPFGTIFTPHMFLMDYTIDEGWHSPRIVPFSEINLHPAAIVLHYSQTVFEGMKAYYGVDGKVRLFRPWDHINRLNRSADRLCIPKLNPDDVFEAIKTLVLLDKDWIPRKKGAALYIRPIIFATEGTLGLKPSKTYTFMIILAPVGAYYAEGFNPVKIYVTEEYIRACPGGTGDVKTGGNYAASLKAQQVACKKGYSQVLWLDAKEKKYVEEVGSMNIFFYFENELATPELTGSILPGVTRDSVLHLAKKLGIPAKERKISIEEVIEGIETGRLKESFGTGTAAVITPVGEICYKEKPYVINNGQTGELTKKFFDLITGIQYGEKEDEFGWTVVLE
ncbi:MAG: branched-chain amino acid aminotransferase [Thermodesulfobacteria bacterium]|nr:branched-chain amino acid aminotransferase [Thermodesulfobacteriota bacterium]